MNPPSPLTFCLNHFCCAKTYWFFNTSLLRSAKTYWFFNISMLRCLKTYWFYNIQLVFIDFLHGLFVLKSKKNNSKRKEQLVFIDFLPGLFVLKSKKTKEKEKKNNSKYSFVNRNYGIGLLPEPFVLC